MPSATKSVGDPSAPLAGARILVVDDHAFSLGLIKDVLFAAGAGAVMTAGDGARAIGALRTFNPDLVLTDWKMPGMDGLAFTQIVRQAGRSPDPRIGNPRVPIVLLSGHASAAAVEQARRAGVNEVVVKPFSVAALVERLAAALSKPRPFVVSEPYIGPDRRRRREQAAKRRRRCDLPPLEQDAALAADHRGPSVLKRLQTELKGVEDGDREPLSAGRPSPA